MLCGSAWVAAAALAAELNELAPPLEQHDFKTDIWLRYLVARPPVEKRTFSVFDVF
jgi:hypothetical protein